MQHKVGDRVSREVYMDDGTWAREGDQCLPRSPLRFGTIISVEVEGYWRYSDNRGWSNILMYRVAWDDGHRSGRYFEHGVTVCSEPTATL